MPATFTSSAPVQSPERTTVPAEDEQAVGSWVTLVWNDPVNLMSYVSYVFRSYFGYDRAEADRLMMQVHTDGRAVVSSGSRERMETDVAAMHGFGLWATLQKDG